MKNPQQLLEVEQSRLNIFCLDTQYMLGIKRYTLLVKRLEGPVWVIVLTSENRSTLPRCGKEDVVLFGLL